MKRKDCLKLIANQLDFLNGKFKGCRTEFTVNELNTADVILTTLESAGIIKPTHKKLTPRPDFAGVYSDDIDSVPGWEE